MIPVTFAYADHFELSVPQSMNVNDKYLGHIRIPDTSSNTRSIVLLSNSTSITIDNRVTISADSQAATFDIYPTETGHFEITALFDGVTHRATFSVYEKGTIQDTEETSIYLWIPENTVAGTQYSGYVLLEKYSPDNRVIKMVGDNVLLPNDITVLAQAYSIVFQFTPLDEGDAFIVAATDGESSRKDTTVYEENSVSTTKRISLYSHDSTVSGQLMIVASLENSAGIPLVIPDDTIIHLKGTSGINVPSSITIPAGQSQGLVHAVVNYDGTVSASSSDFRTGTIDVSTGEKNLSIRIDAAPSPGLPGSVGYFFVWLEDEDGDLYRKKGVTEVFMTSTDREVVSFGKNSRPSSHGIITVSMIDGLYGGELYLGRDGSADITASTTGYGIDTIRMNVGPERLNNECGVYVLDGVVTTVTLEMQQDVRSTLDDALDLVKGALDDSGPSGIFSDIRDVRHELYRYDEENHNRLADAVLELNDSLGDVLVIDAGSVTLDADELRDLYLDLARISSDVIRLDSRSIQSAVEDARTAIVYFELNGDRDRLDGELAILRTVLTESGYGELMKKVDSATGRISSIDPDMSPDASLQKSNDILNQIGTDESKNLLNSIQVYFGEKTMERLFVERSRDAINELGRHTLTDSETFDIPTDSSSLHVNNDVTDVWNRNSVVELINSLHKMENAIESLENPFVNEMFEGLSDELRAALALQAVEQIRMAMSERVAPDEISIEAREQIIEALEALGEYADEDERAARIIIEMVAAFTDDTVDINVALAKLDAGIIALKASADERINLFLGDVRPALESITFLEAARSYTAPLDILNADFDIPEDVLHTLLALNRIPGYTITGINQNVFEYTYEVSASHSTNLINADLAAVTDHYREASEAVSLVLGPDAVIGIGTGNALRLALDNLVIKLSGDTRIAAYDAYEFFKDMLNDYYRDSDLEDDIMDAFFNFQYTLAQAGITHDISAIGDAILVLYLEVDDDPRDSQPVISTQITLDIIPDTTDSIAYGVVAQYVMRDILDRDGNGICLVEPDEIGQYSRASRNVVDYPGQLDGGSADHIVVSSTGMVLHEQVLRPEDIQKDGRHRGAILFELESDDVGEHTVTVSIDDHGIIGLPETINSISYIRVSGSDGMATFSVQERPARALDFISIPVPENGGIVGIAAVLQDDSIIRHDIGIVGDDDISVKRAADQYMVYSNDTYFGTLTASTIQPLDISADMDELPENSMVVLDVPEKVRVGEPFPYYYHIFENGVPMSPNTGGRVSLPDKVITFTSNELSIPSKVEEDYKITVLSGAGVTTKNVEAVSSSLVVDSGSLPDTVQVGEDFFIKLESQIQDILYRVQSSIPSQYLEDNNEIKFSPKTEGEHTVVVTGTRPGYEPYVNEFEVTVENTLNIYIETVGAESVPFDMVLASTKSEDIATPYSFQTEPSDLLVTFPLQHKDDTGGYSFDSLTVGPERDFMTDLSDNKFETSLQTDLYLIAHYNRDISVTVLGGSGSGVYDRGETVTVRATDVEIIPILLYERFDSWSGPVPLDMRVDTFIAESDVVITATYYIDHSTWMLIVVASAGTVAIVVTLKRSSKFAWIFKNIGPSK